MKPTWTETLRSWFRRPAARRTASRAFTAAQPGRLAGGWGSTNPSMNAELYRQLDTLRARSRDLTNNNDYAKRFVSMVDANVVGGSGITLQSRIYDAPGRPDNGANKAVEAAWERWGARGSCEVTGRLSLRQVCSLAVRTAAGDGEHLVRIIRGVASGNAFGFALQLLDVDRIDTRLVRAPANGVNEIKMGVEIDGYGRAVAYWLRPYHPGEMFLVEGISVGSHNRVPADEVIHLYMPYRVEQVRGLPWMHAAMMRLNNLGGYEEAAVIAARVGASKMGWFETPDGTVSEEDGEDAEGVPYTEVEPGQFGVLPAGQKFTPFNPDYPHQMYEQFVKACLRGIASGMGVAYHALANDLTSVSFSSIRSGTLEERDQWMAIQSWFIESFLEPIFAEWLRSALAFGQVTLDNGSALSVAKIDKFSAHTWQPRRWQWVDPKNDMEANILAVKNGFKSRTTICNELGVDFEDVLAQLKAEQDLADQMGVQLGEPPPVAPEPPADPAETVAATGKAFAAALEKMPAQHTTVENRVEAGRAPDVHVAAPVVNLKNEVTVPEREVTLEARIETPEIHVAAPAVNVKTFPERMVETIERDDKGEISRVLREAAD